MKVSKLIEITEMNQKDIQDAVELTDKENWSNTAEDWERLYRIGGSIVAKEEGEMIGISSALDFGKIGTIGNVVVKEKKRLAGIGKLLVEKSIERLEKCETIKVHSLMPAASFYRSSILFLQECLHILNLKWMNIVCNLLMYLNLKI